MMVAVGELLASVALKTVFSKLGNLAFNATWNEIALQLNFSKDLRSINDRLSFIQSFLKDAERQPSKLESVRHSLKKLKAAACDLEDMLLLFESGASTYKDSGTARKELLAFFKRLKMPHKVKSMRKTIEEIVDNHKIFDFSEDAGMENKEVIKKRETISLTSEVTVGRIDEKERIISLLQTDGGHSTIPIYGFGGVGKTTLAQMVFNDDRTKALFDDQAWVYVSVKFDIMGIGQSIISQLDKTSGLTGSNLESVQRHLSNIINNKRVLIVLDDLWEEEPLELEKIRTLLQGGKAGSKIVVTTRLEKVARLMNKSMAVKLGSLPNDYCWELFRAKAFPPGPADSDKENVGRQIVERCKGMPLAVKSLGYLCQTTNQWEVIRDSEIWAEDGDDGPLKETTVLPSLKLSYHYMPYYLKPCFAYCAVFPKGCHIEKNSLIQQWIALGFIQATGELFTAQEHGEIYFKELLEMSFLQDVAGISPIPFARNNKPQGVLFQMHDLVRELARLVAGDEVIVCDAKWQQTHGNADNYRYMSLSNICDSSLFYGSIPSTTRALHFKNCSMVHTSFKSLMGAEFLRVLDLTRCTNIAGLPASIGKLRLLKFLNISGMQTSMLPMFLSTLHGLQALNISENSCLVELPHYIFELVNLQYLDLHGCSNLKELPEDIHKLNELLHLNLSGCASLQWLPEGFGGLGKLVFLDLSYCPQLQMLPLLFGELQELMFLNLSHCYELQMLPVSFCDLSNMIHLNMSFCRQLRVLPSGLFKFMKKLLGLYLSGCTSLKDLPEFAGPDAGCLKLEILDLSDCTNLASIPKSCTTLHELRYLNLSCCSQIGNFLNLIPSWKFVKMEYLNLSRVAAKGDSKVAGTSTRIVEGSRNHFIELELNMLREDIITNHLVHLKYLSVGGFTLFSEQGFANLEDLQTLPNFYVQQRRGELHSNIIILQQILDLTHHELNIGNLENVVSPEEAKLVELCRKQQLHVLSLEWSSENESSTTYVHSAKATAVLEQLRPYHNINHLSIKGYGGMAFPGWINEINDTLPNLVKIVLSDLKRCEHIPTLGYLPNLQELEINNMPLLHHVRLVPCKKLRRLTFVKLQANTTVLIFYDDDNTQTQVNEVELSHDCGKVEAETGDEAGVHEVVLSRDCDEEERETGEKPDKLSGPLPVNKQGKRRSLAEALRVNVKDWFKAPYREMSRDLLKRMHDISAENDAHVVTSRPAITQGPFKERRAQAVAIPKLDYFMIESCHDLKLYPYIPMCKEYIIKDSRLDVRLDDKLSRRMFERDFRSGTLGKLKISLSCLSGHLPLLFTSIQELELVGSTAIDDGLLSTLRQMTKLEKLTIPSIKLAETKQIHELSVNCIAYVSTREVALFSVRLKGEGWVGSCPTYSQQLQWEEGMEEDEVEEKEEEHALHFPTGSASSCSSNFSDLYKYHDYEIQQLIIQNLEHVERAEEVINKNHKLAQYQHLQSLSLMWCSSSLSLDSSIANDIAVLEKLQPHGNLKTLCIQGYRGDTLCSWLRDTSSSLQNLVIVELSDMIWCEDISFLGQLENLEELCISNMPCVREVDIATYGDKRPFWKLRKLTIQKISSLEEWKLLQFCDNLKQLSIHSCIDLFTMPDIIRSYHFLMKLEILECWNFSALPEWLGELVSLRELSVHAAKLELLPRSIQDLSALDTLVLKKCNYRLRERCTAGEDRNKIKHIARVDTSEGIEVSINSSGDIALLQKSPQLIELNIKDLQHLSGSKAKGIELVGKEDLQLLSLEWMSSECYVFDKVALEKLQPHQNLRRLCIRNYPINADFPNWMQSLPNLVSMDLSNVQAGHLYLDNLQNLEDLYVSSLFCLPSSLRISSAQPLKKLKRVAIVRVDNLVWESSCLSSENMFPGLEYLEIDCCLKVIFEPSIPRSASYKLSGDIQLRHLFNWPSFKQVMGLSTYVSSSKMEIKYSENLSSGTFDAVRQLDIKELTIDSCTDPVPLPECIRGWKSLWKLEILNCENIKTLPEWLGEMASLRELKVETYWMKVLPPCMERLTSLQTLALLKCTNRLKQRCSYTGDDWSKIKHIVNLHVEEKKP